jgi:hypothetical protein
MITEGAPAVAHTEAAEPQPAPAPMAAAPMAPAPHDVDGLELPSWDEEDLVRPLLSQMEHRPTIDLDIPEPPEDGESEVLEATDEDLDVDSLPLSVRSRATPGHAQPAVRDLFVGMPAQPSSASPSSLPPAASPSEPVLPVVGGVVPENVSEALREQRAAKAEGSDEEAPTSVMSDQEAAAMAASFPPPEPRSSLADLPPPPDMPAPIPAAGAEEKKPGLFGRMFGRKGKK